MSQPKQHPEWLNKSFIEKVIRLHTKDEKARVSEFAIQSGSKPGESFASDLLRASINYATGAVSKSISVMVKMMPTSGEGGDIDGGRLFRTEMKMYSDTLIAINRLILNAHGSMKLFPR